MKQKLLANDPLTNDDIYPIIIYVVLSAFFFSYTSSKLGTQQNDSGIWLYGILTQSLLYVYCYKTLRKRNSYLVWLCFASIHFGAYLLIFNSMTLKNQLGPGYTVLRNTLPLILVILVLRWISLKWQKKQLIPVFRYADLHGNRKTTNLDLLLFAIYLFTMLALSIVLR